MAETLGMLCDKLTIVKLKQYHTTDEVRLISLNKQCDQLQIEIDEYFSDGFAGTLKEVNQSDRDKLRKYWECWFETRNVDDVNVGAKGIDLGAL